MKIYELMHPYFEAYKNMHANQKSDEINGYIEELKAGGMDLNIFNSQQSKLRLIKSFTTPGSFNGTSWIVEVDEDLVKKLLKSVHWKIDEECKKYAAKLEQKIRKNLLGDSIKSLNVKGLLWADSRVEVTGVSGKILTFETKFIVNKSKFEEKYLQFPTRVRSGSDEL